MLLRLLRAYRVGITRELNGSLAYRGALAVWMLGILGTSYIALAVWLAVLGDKAAIGSFGRAELVRYYLSSALIAMLTDAWAIYFVSGNIRNGGLNEYLLQPWSYLHHYVINNLGEKVIKLTVLLPMFLVVALGFWRDWRWEMAWWEALLLPLSILLAASITLLFSVCVGLLSFWVIEVAGIWAFYEGAVAFLSGRLIPLALFPAWLQAALWWLPFRYMLSLPLELVVGHLSPRETWASMGIQALWLLAAYGLYRLLWRVGIRSYEAVGG